MSSDYKDLVMGIRESGDFNRLVNAIPYAGFIGMECQKTEDSVVFLLPANKQNIGNPLIPALHGGVMGAFMEMSAAFQLILFMDEPRLPKIIDFSLDYLHAGLLKDTWAACEVCRQGSRVANVAITAWQDDKNAPIAIARAHFRLAETVQA